MKAPASWPAGPAASLHEAAGSAARARQALLTKPRGALGRLEQMAVLLAAMQGKETPELTAIHMVLFVADHGVTDQGISAYPQSVTVEMLRNIIAGGAAASVLARQIGAKLEVIDLGCVIDSDLADGVVRVHLGPGTADLSRRPAMTPEQLDGAVRAGVESALRARDDGADIYLGGEMGIGNTTAATAVACGLLHLPAGELAGPGSGLGVAGVRHKVAVIERALLRHTEYLCDPWEILRRLGGFEIAALTGAYTACATLGMPALVDGYISTVAALSAVRLNPAVRDWLLFSHTSAEPGHRRILAALEAEPLLDLGMRLGEGSGAAVAVPLLRLACALHNGMATFEEAGVSRGDG